MKKAEFDRKDLEKLRINNEYYSIRMYGADSDCTYTSLCM